jgi:putative transcriptional regulator
MALKYKIDVLAALKSSGYTTYRIKKEKLLSEGVLTSIRSGEPVSMKVLNKLCTLLDCQPGDILSWEPDSESK